MDGKLSPDYACLFVGYVEEQIKCCAIMLE